MVLPQEALEVLEKVTKGEKREKIIDQKKEVIMILSCILQNEELSPEDFSSYKQFLEEVFEEGFTEAARAYLILPSVNLKKK